MGKGYENCLGCGKQMKAQEKTDCQYGNAGEREELLKLKRTGF